MVVAKKEKIDTEGARDAALKAQKVTKEVTTAAETKKKKFDDAGVHSCDLLKIVEAAQDQIKISSHTNFKNHQGQIKVSSHQENQLFELFHHYLVPLAKDHKHEVITQVLQLVVYYKFEVLDLPNDDAIEVHADTGKTVDDAPEV